MDLENITLSKSERQYHMILPLYAESDKIPPQIQNRNRLTDKEGVACWRTGKVEGIDWEFGIDKHTLLY